MNWTRWLQWKPHVSSLIPHAFNSRDLASLTSLEVDEHLAKAGEGMSDSTRHHDAVAVQHIENRTSSFVAFVLFCSRLVGTDLEQKETKETKNAPIRFSSESVGPALLHQRLTATPFVAFVLFCSRLCRHRSGTEGNGGNEEYIRLGTFCSRIRAIGVIRGLFQQT